MSGWKAVKLTDFKKPTRYSLTTEAGTTVLHAQAQAAATMLGHRVDRVIVPGTWVSWRWKVAGVIPGADNTVAAREDAPARLMFEFAGDKSRLPWEDHAVDLVTTAASGRELPFATLMYLWSGAAPTDTLVPNPRTKRIQMVVVSGSDVPVGTWVEQTRDLYADFVRAFGEPPGRLTAVAVMTDTDNTGQTAEAWYGDISFSVTGKTSSTEKR